MEKASICFSFFYEGQKQLPVKEGKAVSPSQTLTVW